MNTRLIAARVISNVLQDGKSLNTALDNALLSVESTKDKAFIQALCYGVCRYFYRLSFILNELLDKPIKDSEINALALVGLYQLNYMRVKQHAAVSETVLAVKKKTWAKSLVNALLRTYLRQQGVLEQKADENVAASVSHPVWLLRQIEIDWPERSSQILEANNRQPPMVLRVNLALNSRDQYLQSLSDHELAAKTVSFCESSLILSRPVPVELLPGFEQGHVSVQDTAAQLAAGLLDVQVGQRVLDVCAAPGGKTVHILESQPHLKELVAIDIDEARLSRVQENLLRSNVSAQLIVGDAAKPKDWWDGQLFDRILLDAPCSALGVIRRHPDIKILRKPDDIKALQLLQKSILAATWPLLSSGGLLLYATCSILKQENEEQIMEFLAMHADAFEVPIDATWGNAVQRGRQILTGDSEMDGFYYALIKKS